MNTKILAIASFFMLLISSGCDDKNEESFVVDIGLEMSVKNTEGVDMLDPGNPGSLKKEDIKLFYLKNGETEYINEGHLDHPKGFSIFQKDGSYRISIALNHTETEAYPVTYIQWNEDRTDTLKCEIDRKPGLVMCNKVWLNNELAWEAYDSERYIELLVP